MSLKSWLKRLTLLIVLFLVSLRGYAFDRVEFCKMEDILRDMAPELAIQKERIRTFLSDKQVIFVNGYMGCSISGFRDNRKMIREIDRNIPTEVICPPSDIAIDDNAEFIVRSVQKFASRRPERKVILIGQSKGGAEVLQTLALRPELMESKATWGFEVSHAVTISAAIGGSAMADMVLKKDPELVEKWDRFVVENNLPNSTFVKWLTNMFLDPNSEGFHSLSSERAENRNQRLISYITPETQDLLRERLFFVTAYRNGTENDMPFYMKSIAKFMATLGEANDGLVAEKDQRISGLGTHLLEVGGAGHFSLIDDYGAAKCRHEFTRLVLLKLATGEAEKAERITPL